MFCDVTAGKNNYFIVFLLQWAVFVYVCLCNYLLVPAGNEQITPIAPLKVYSGPTLFGKYSDYLQTL